MIVSFVVVVRCLLFADVYHCLSLLDVVVVYRLLFGVVVDCCVCLIVFVC